MERTGQGCMKADVAPAKAGQTIMDKLEHAIVRANNLNSAAAGITEFMLGPRPPRARAEVEKSTGCFVDEIKVRLDELNEIIGEAHGYLDELRQQF